MQTSQAVQARDLLFQALKVLKFDTETVVEILPSRVNDHLGKECPLLEIVSTDFPEADLMADDLGIRDICIKFNLDIEVSTAVCRFITRDSMIKMVADEDREG